MPPPIVRDAPSRKASVFTIDFKVLNSKEHSNNLPIRQPPPPAMPIRGGSSFGGGGGGSSFGGGGFGNYSIGGPGA